AGQSLMSDIPQSGRIVKRDQIDSLGLKIWTLSNGITMILKPTDFKNDEILMGAFSPGGHSLIEDDRYVPAATAASLVNESGLGAFDKIQFNKLLAGKLVRVNAWIGELQEGLSGNSTPQDLETMFQLIHLYFTQPRLDSTAFMSFQSRMKAYLQNRSSSPEECFEDTIDVTLSQNHLRARPFNAETLDRMDIQQSASIYRDRFAEAGDFTFILVGNLDLTIVSQLAERYLASLPTSHRKESWKDREINPPVGIIEKSLKKGIEPKSMVRIIYSGPHTWSQADNYRLGSLVQVMQIKLREAIREDKGGTYGVQVNQSIAQYPDPEYAISISFGCDPKRVNELTQTIFQIIDSTQQFPIKADYIEKVKEIQRRERETNLKENRFWLSILQSYFWNGMDPMLILQYNKLVESLTPAMIQQTAREVFNPRRYVKVVLYPETQSE
ncbi:MAG: insulinase family protein, partial [Candidatus Delongbacteria bacterium]|nr:insulinase family protein [Candidatus Delongbacteria bacterium]